MIASDQLNTCASQRCTAAGSGRASILLPGRATLLRAFPVQAANVLHRSGFKGTALLQGRSKRTSIQRIARPAVSQVGPDDPNFSLTARKALEVNLNPTYYGVLAEIGAGQEVARWFFRVGAAAGTVAKSVSAYDMTISDATYGAAARYVTRERVDAMLDSEYLQCSLALRAQRGTTTAFFAFADSVVAKAFNRDNECHGWMGIKYQSTPRADPSTVVLHCRMLDGTAQLQQEAIGVLGVNFIHGVLTHPGSPHDIIKGLLDDLDDRMEVDAIDFKGPDYHGYDNRVAALQLVQRGHCDAVLFTPKGVLQIPHEALYKQNVLLMRGRFRPFTNLHNDMLMSAAQQFFCNVLGAEASSHVTNEADSYGECVYRDDTMVLLEITTKDMLEAGDMLDWTSEVGVQEHAFIQRIEALATMGYDVLLSNYRRYFNLAAYLSRYTKCSKVIVMGVPSLIELFKERHYADLEGGILENFGRLLKLDLKLYVYPTIDVATGRLITASDVKVDPSVQKLYDYILERGTIVPISEYDAELLRHGDVSKFVLESIRQGTQDWKPLVPRHVQEQITGQRLLGYNPDKRPPTPAPEPKPVNRMPEGTAAAA